MLTAFNLVRLDRQIVNILWIINYLLKSNLPLSFGQKSLSSNLYTSQVSQTCSFARVVSWSSLASQKFCQERTMTERKLVAFVFAVVERSFFGWRFGC